MFGQNQPRIFILFLLFKRKIEELTSPLEWRAIFLFCFFSHTQIDNRDTVSICCLVKKKFHKVQSKFLFVGFILL